MKLKDACSFKEKLWPTRQHIKKQRHCFANKGPSSQRYGFSSSHLCMWELDYKESWELKNLCFWTAVLDKTLEGPLDYKEIQPVHPKGDQSWLFIGRTDAKAETPIVWPPDVKDWLIGKIPWRRKSQPTPVFLPGKFHGWRSLVGYCPWGRKESDTTEQLHYLSIYRFSSSHVWMWELDYKESWELKN